MIKCVFFDLDGTLLPMDQEQFIQAYMKGLVTKLAPRGYEPKSLAKTIWACTEAMVRNKGSATNETLFRTWFAQLTGRDMALDDDLIEEYYRLEFQDVQKVCGFTKEAAPVIKWLRQHNVMRVLATNPLFPAMATHSRVRWAGLSPEDFDLITTYENSSFSKPNPAYYRWLLEKLQLRPEECLMVGNDAQEDGMAAKLGMEVFLLTHSLIDRQGEEYLNFAHGDFSQLQAWLERHIFACE